MYSKRTRIFSLGTRNVLVHDYFDADFEIVWKIVERDLLPLEQATRLILAELP
jgi:uncharacterized protein with HEPN domain